MILTAALSAGVLSGCGGKENGNVSIVIGNAPTEGQSGYETYMTRVDEFAAVCKQNRSGKGRCTAG